ncbi:MAG: hypothetical protein K1X57_09170 [Gemmataceae bacterium]|nr:hypothetical protein [Gemmataceae bacterium]
MRLPILCLTSLMAASGCSTREGTAVAKDNQSIQVGGLYASENKDGTWRVTKVLAVDECAVHLRTYANKFPELPADVDPATLTLGRVGDPGGFGIGHYPVTKEGFLNENRVLIKVVPVMEEELEGYRYYLEAMKEDR